MTPTLVHRYAWPIREAIEQLLGDDAGDAEAWRIRIEADELVIDIVAPAYAGRTIEVPENFDVDKLCDMIVAGEFKMPTPAERVPIKEAPSIEMAAPSNEAEEINTPEKPKGGPLAQRAGIICAEKGFWRFLAEKYGKKPETADAAADWLRSHLQIESRAALDHAPEPAAGFREVEKEYRFWLDGW